MEEQFKQFTGQLGEVRIWNIALSQAQIQATMNAPLSGHEPGLVGYYNFSDQNGNDSSNTGNNATPVGAPNYTSPGPVSTGATITIPTNTMITLTGTSKSTAYSKVTVNIDGFSPITFTGVGENVALVSEGQSVVSLQSGAAVSANLAFDYSMNGAAGPFQTVNVSPPVLHDKNGYVTVVNKADNGYSSVAFVLNWKNQ